MIFISYCTIGCSQPVCSLHRFLWSHLSVTSIPTRSLAGSCPSWHYLAATWAWQAHPYSEPSEEERSGCCVSHLTSQSGRGAPYSKVTWLTCCDSSPASWSAPGHLIQIMNIEVKRVPRTYTERVIPTTTTVIATAIICRIFFFPSLFDHVHAHIYVCFNIVT